MKAVLLTAMMLGVLTTKTFAKEAANLTAKAISHFQKLESRLVLNEKKEPIFLSLYDRELTKEDLTHLSALTALEELSISSCDVGDEIWASIEKCDKLRKLAITASQISDIGLANLEKFPDLQSLDLNSSKKISDAGLVHVGKMKKLVSLDLIGTNITSKGISHLTGMSSLTKLCVASTSVGDAGLIPIAKLITLKELSLSGTKITNAGLKHLAPLSEVRLLEVHITLVTEEGLTHLEGLPKLETLYLCVPVTKVGLKSLKKMNSLRHLYIGDEADNKNELRPWLEKELPGIGAY